MRKSYRFPNKPNPKSFPKLDIFRNQYLKGSKSSVVLKIPARGDKMKKILAASFFCFLGFGIGVNELGAAKLSSDDSIHLMIGESKLLHVESAQKIAIGNPAVADVTGVSDEEILVSAKSPGNTNLIFISPSGEKETRSVIVSAHNLKKSMVQVGLEIMEIETSSAL